MRRDHRRNRNLVGAFAILGMSRKERRGHDKNQEGNDCILAARILNQFLTGDPQIPYHKASRRLPRLESRSMLRA